jgi:hypothetical protein
MATRGAEDETLLKEPTRPPEGRNEMYPIAVQDLTRIRQDELRRAASEHRIAMQARSTRRGQEPGNDLRSAVAALFRPLRSSGGSPA